MHRKDEDTFDGTKRETQLENQRGADNILSPWFSDDQIGRKQEKVEKREDVLELYDGYKKEKIPEMTNLDLFSPSGLHFDDKIKADQINEDQFEPNMWAHKNFNRGEMLWQ